MTRRGRRRRHLPVFSNGVTWQFDAPKQAKKTAQGLTSALGGQLA